MPGADSEQNILEDHSSGRVKSPEELSLANFGFSVQPYSGEIPTSTFTTPIGIENKNQDNAGSTNQIFIEPGQEVCHKTRLRPEDSNEDHTKLTILTEPTNEFSNLPGHLKEGLFLAAVDKFDLKGIPKFLGFTLLPDKRIATTEQYIDNSILMPDTRRDENAYNQYSPQYIMSMIRAMDGICTSIDFLHSHGSEPSNQEIMHNLRMQDENGRVNKIWLTDFEGFTLPDDEPNTRPNTIALGTTISKICESAIRSKSPTPENEEYHPATQYLNFAVFQGENIGNWQAPKNNQELLQNLLHILEYYPVDAEITNPYQGIPVQLTAHRDTPFNADAPFEIILD